VSGDGVFQSECRVVLSDGSVRWVVSRGRVGVGAGREPVRLRVVSADITPRKRAELEAQRSREEITHLSRVAALGELSGALGHELSQPLGAILSNAQAAQRLLARGEPDLGEVREILEDIVADDKRAGEIIHHLRSLLRKGDQQQDELDLSEVVRKVLELLRAELVSRGVTLHAELEAKLPRVTGDRIQLQQVVLNLVTNALDAMASVPAAERRLAVRTERAADGGARVSVSDAGVGVPPEMLERIFHPFVTTKPDGLGLGLSICRTIVTAHGGRLWAESGAGGGATFVFVLPSRGESRG
jgi:C4-dicarboxylate-specific signal transduction histidine kinase